MPTISYFAPGIPVAKGRPRAYKMHNGHIGTYTPDKTVDWERNEIARKLRDTASMHARPLDAWNISRYGMLVSEERRLAAKLGRAFYAEAVTEAREAVETNGQEVS